MAPGMEYITHEVGHHDCNTIEGPIIFLCQDPEHDCGNSMHRFDACVPCTCIEVKEKGPHCCHCYHCPYCSSLVAMGCRKCLAIGDRELYRSFLRRHRKDGYIETDEEWENLPDEEKIQEVDFYPNTPSPPPPPRCEEEEGQVEGEARCENAKVYNAREETVTGQS